jgi:hypothetical protein
MRKETAIEWLIGELKGYDEDCEIFQKAKAMEREQMVDFALNCQEMFKHQIQERYNETYKGGEQ